MQAGIDERLLKALAEQLKLPLLQIARSAELMQSSPHAGSLQHISFAADAALRLVDGFLLSARLHGEQTFQLEPVSVSSVLSDTAHALQPLAKQYECDVMVSLAGKYGPAMAHRESLQSALMLIGYSLIEGRISTGRRHEITLGAHKSPHGLVAGVFDNQPGVSSDMLRRGRSIYGKARQALPSVTATNGAGVFVADALMRAMASPLRVGRHNKLTGLAATLNPSTQLRLV